MRGRPLPGVPLLTHNDNNGNLNNSGEMSDEDPIQCLGGGLDDVGLHQ